MLICATWSVLMCHINKHIDDIFDLADPANGICYLFSIIDNN